MDISVNTKLSVKKSKLLKEITDRLVKEFNPEKVILFGSYARGEPNEESDIDICVIVSKSDIRPTQRAVRAYRCLNGLSDISRDIIVKTKDEFDKYKEVYAALECQIDESGKVLYVQKPKETHP